MPPRFLLHADDIGLSRAITAGIVHSVDQGLVRSVSLIVNGSAFDEAVRAIAARPAVRVSVHLNLLEGRPLSPAEDIPLLVNAKGMLTASFVRLVRLWLGGDARQRAQLSEQMQLEFAAQIARGREALKRAFRPADLLRIDSHTHIHALNFVLDAILASAGPAQIAYVRVPREPWHVGPDPGDRRSVLGVNSIKWALLNRLSRNMIGKLQARGIGYNPALLGVLHTGRMSVAAIEAGLNAILQEQRCGRETLRNEPVEVLLHPGKAHADEAGQWAGRSNLLTYYLSSNRDLEARTARELRSSSVWPALTIP